MTDSLFDNICDYLENVVTEMAKHKAPRKEWHYTIPIELRIALRKATDAGLFENKSCD